MSVNIEIGNEESQKKQWFTSFTNFLSILSVLGVTLLILYLCKEYTKSVLLWLEFQDPFVIVLTLVILFTIVSFPISIGYIVIVIAAGYLFGFIRGFFLSVIGANLGLLIAHNIMKMMGHHASIRSWTNSETAQAIIRVISGPLSFKIVFCSRLTPIPFGLQNIIFAVSNVNTKIYHIASLLGLVPGQIVGIYVGQSLRSMQDVLENQKHLSPFTYVFATLQLIFSVILMVWLSGKARRELASALLEAETKFGGNEKTMSLTSTLSLV